MLVTGQHDIHEDDFSKCIQQMHLERDRMFEIEYKVSSIILMCQCMLFSE